MIDWQNMNHFVPYDNVYMTGGFKTSCIYTMSLRINAKATELRHKIDKSENPKALSGAPELSAKEPSAADLTFIENESGEILIVESEN